MSTSKLSLLLVKSNVDIMVVATPFCHSCFEKKTNDIILKQFSITGKEYQQLLKYGVNKGVRIKCECSNPLKIT